MDPTFTRHPVAPEGIQYGCRVHKGETFHKEIVLETRQEDASNIDHFLGAGLQTNLGREAGAAACLPAESSQREAAARRAGPMYVFNAVPLSSPDESDAPDAGRRRE